MCIRDSAYCVGFLGFLGAEVVLSVLDVSFTQTSEVVLHLLYKEGISTYSGATKMTETARKINE